MSGAGLKPIEGVVGEILARTLVDLELRRAEASADVLESQVAGAPRSLAGALRAPGLGLIAEIKPRSPSRGALRPSEDPMMMLPRYAPYVAAVSVLADAPYFGGGLPLVARVAREAPVPVLCKGFIVSEYQILEARVAGADAVLLMASLLAPARLAALLSYARELGMDALVEVHDEQELQEVLTAGAQIVGVNSRDLRSLQIDLARGAALLAAAEGAAIRVAESGIAVRADVDRIRGIADAALIGSTLMSAADPAAKIEELGWTACR